MPGITKASRARLKTAVAVSDRRYNETAGPPTLYCKAFDEMVRRYRLLGLGIPQIAFLFGVVDTTISVWLRKHRSFAEGWAAGSADADGMVAAALFKTAVGYEREEAKYVDNDGNTVCMMKYYPPSVSAAEFWLTNRQPDLWKKQKEQVAPTPSQPAAPTTIILDFGGKEAQTIDGQVVNGD